MTSPIAVVGMACRFPDARSPDELWDNVLAQRRAFRRLPAERLNLGDYFSEDHATPDATYATQAALIEGHEFDRTRFRVAGNTFRSADMAHWLALEVAADALSDAGFADGRGLPKDACGVLLGNSLTGEFSRANLMRLRWPYVQRVVHGALERTGWSAEDRVAFLTQLEADYKAPFPPVGDETLAGGLSNTIAGRICNHFDLQGGGYTVDGACASSLLALANACSALVAGDLDVALAGGVDLSLDPFELVGFAKVGALAEDEMRVFDARSSGFWPGEGCGFVVLMRLDDAIHQCRRIYAVVRGWGISSDGSGGLTRPEVAGQRLALQRAYRRAGCGIDAVGFFEGHGTGTPIGDLTELRTLSQTRRAASPGAPSAAIGSIKANIGHTKAASGIAGFIKAVMAIDKQLIPPSTGWEIPHPALAEEGDALELLHEGKIWPSDVALLAGVSGMGFGGINAHVVLAGAASDRRHQLATRECSLISSPQDAEMFVLSGRDRQELTRLVEHLLSYASRLSRAELIDLAACLAATTHTGLARAAIVASTPEELRTNLETLAASLAGESDARIGARDDVLFALRETPPRIGFLFSGQGSPANLSGGMWRRRFNSVAELYDRINLPRESDGVATEVAQPAIVTASLAGLRVLSAVGVQASVAIGHSLGELVAYHWAGAMDEPTLLRLAAARGQAISQCSVPGAMASILAAPGDVERWLENRPVVISGLNSPTQTVISGEEQAVEEVVAQARSVNIHAIRLRVSHAFHSPLVADAVPALSQALAAEVFRPLNSKVVSTVTGQSLEPSDDLRDLMVRQITSPVRFVESLQAADDRADLWIEVGPGRVLQGIVRDSTETPVVALDAGGDSLRNLLRAIAAAFVLGAPIRPQALFDGRFRRPFDLNWQPRFFVNPCELAPASESLLAVETEAAAATPAPGAETTSSPVFSPRLDEAGEKRAAVDVVRQLAAARAELPLSAVRAEHRLLNDLHLSSIAVGQLFVDAARTLGLAPPESPTDAANATVAEVAEALEELAESGERSHSAKESFPPGIDAWARAFTVEWVERPLPRRPTVSQSGRWQVLAPQNHALANALRKSIDKLSGQGVIVCLPADLQEQHIDLLLEAARRVVAEQQATKFVLALNGGVGASFAKSLALELPEVTTCVVDTPADDPRAVVWVVAEAEAAIGYCEASYDAEGIRREPVLRRMTLPQEEAAVPLDSDDVLLVTGGGKGIAAECAFALAKETGARLALLGRSEVDRDKELAANLDRMTAAGVSFKYLVADVTRADAVQAAVSEVQSQWGQITAVLHAAGVNKPQRLTSLDRDAVLATLGPKIDGARNLLAAIDPDQLRLFVTFGSIIGRAGMAGQADYALANEWLTHLTEAWQATHPHCHCLALEWSVWSGVGMGERLGTVDALKRQGISPITIDDGLQTLRRLIAMRVPAPAVVVAGRFGDPPTLQLDTPDLPLLRFLERPRVFVPGVELVADAEVSLDSDPYLKDHVYQRVPLLPAVVGLEAMTQVAMALAGTNRVPVLENVRFDQPVVVPQHAGITLRVAALQRESGQIEVVLRSSETDFQQDHFSAVCSDAGELPECPALEIDDLAERLDLDPRRDLYGGILFHTGRFQRLRGYRRLESKQCIAEISRTGHDAWFGQYLPAELVLGDAAARDTVIHCVQACIPHHTLLPIGVERLMLAAGLAAPLTVQAREVSQDGDVFTYDLDVVRDDGVVCEQWRGLRLRRVNDVAPDASWHDALWRPYLERRVGELLPAGQVSIVVERNGSAPRQARRRHAIQQAVGAAVEIHTRPDGKPEAACDELVSVSHAADMTMAVAGRNAVACDAESIVSRADDNVWRDLLGADRLQLAKLIAKRCHEDSSTATTRVWAAEECLKKAGSAFDAPLVFDRHTPDGWAVLTAGPLHIATWVMPRRGEAAALVVAVLVRCESARV